MIFTFGDDHVQHDNANFLHMWLGCCVGDDDEKEE